MSSHTGAIASEAETVIASTKPMVSPVEALRRARAIEHFGWPRNWFRPTNWLPDGCGEPRHGSTSLGIAFRQLKTIRANGGGDA